MKKLIIVTKALWIGGIETALVNLLDNIDYNKYDVTLLVLKAELNLMDRINPKCNILIADRDKTVTFENPYKFSRLYHLTEESESPSRFHRMMMWTVPFMKWLENKLFIRYISNNMIDKKYDTAIIYSDVVGETVVKGIKAKKYLMYYHHGAMRHVYHDDIAWKRCEKVIAVSNNQAALLKEFFPDYAEKITVVHNFADVDSILTKGSCKADDYFDSKFFNIVSVGRVSHEKGMDIAVEVCEKLIRDGYQNVRWWIVGGGPDMQEVLDTIEKTNMKDYVIPVGMKSNPYPYIKNADLYVQPSRFEGYPMTILEALILGQPVVSTDNNGAKEILVEDETGILCPIDSDCIALRIQYLLENPQVLERLKTNVRGIDLKAQNRIELQKLEELL